MRSPVRALAHPARIRIADERTVKERVQDAMDRVVYKPVTHACLVDVAGLWVTNPEMMVRTMAIHTIAQFAMECKHIVHQSRLELLHIGLVTFPTRELLPG
jgi:hypothetical protein